jgi:PAS domain S-box-containing protein
MHGPPEALFDAPVGVVFVSPSGILLRANHAFCALAGADASTMIDRPIGETLAADDPADDVHLHMALASGGDSSLKARRVLLRPDGARRTVECTCWLVREPDGAPRYLCAIVTDVTGLEATARVHAERLEGVDRIFATAPFGIAVFDASLHIQRTNPALAALLLVPVEELIGKSYYDLIAPGEQQDVKARVAALTDGVWGASQVDRRFVDARGRVKYLSTSGTRVRIDGEVLYYCLFIDVTERYAAEAERAQLHEQVLHAERLRTLGQLAAGIAHEVNNPAAIAVGAVELARKHLAAIAAAIHATDLPAVRRHAERLDTSLRYCEDGSARLAKVARKLGAFSSLHGGEVTELDVSTLVRRALDLVANDLRHRAELVVDLQPLPPLHVYPGRLVLAFTNLLLNAAQAIDGLPAAHRITIVTQASADEVLIVVADTGIGLPAALVDRIFEPFFTTRGPTEGTGLGLTVVNDVVRQHRGHIEVRSEPGRGTRFTVHLPLANGLGATVAPPPVAPSPVALRRGRVLLVDDEPLLLDILSDFLAPEHDVVCAPGGVEALTLLAQDTAFDAVLCDLMMPGVDGIAVHAYLLEHAPALAGRTVFSTGGAFTARAAAYVDTLGERVLLKPFTAEQALAILALARAKTA